MEYKPIENYVTTEPTDPPKVFSAEALSHEAHLAFQLIERWGMVTAVPDGEDSAGRRQWRREEPEEVVSRAFTIATMFVQEARNRGLTVALPRPQTWEERDAEREAKRAERRAASKDL